MNRGTGCADTLDIFLGAENARFDAGAGTGVTQKCHRRLGILNGDLQGGAQLVAVKRAVAKLVGPLGGTAGIIVLARGDKDFYSAGFR